VVPDVGYGSFAIFVFEFFLWPAALAGALIAGLLFVAGFSRRKRKVT
jgi:hypothetical protein